MTLSESINKMIEQILSSSTWTSAGGANPVDNFIKEVRGVENPALEDDIKDAIQDSSIKQNKAVNDNIKQVKKMEAGNVGDISRMTTEQFGNVVSFSKDPVSFFFGAFGKKFIKRLVSSKSFQVALIMIAAEAITKTIINEMQKPGRPFDIRFKRTIQKEILIFRRRQEKEKLKRGFSRIIVTSIARLRGGQYQTYDSFRAIAAGSPPLIEGFDVKQPTAASIPYGTSKKHGHRTFGGPGR